MPAGRIVARATVVDGEVTETSFQNVPSFLYLREQQVEVPGIGLVEFDVAYGGAFYAFVNAEAVGLTLEPEHFNRIIDYGRRIKHAVMAQFPITHPFETDLSFLYGTIFTGPPRDPSHHSRNVCIFADGELDRSATGSGVSARAALHFAKGELGLNEAYHDREYSRQHDVSESCRTPPTSALTTPSSPKSAAPPQSLAATSSTSIRTILFGPDLSLDRSPARLVRLSQQ